MTIFELSTYGLDMRSLFFEPCESVVEVSVAEWRFAMAEGRNALDDDDFGRASDFVHHAAMLAGRMLVLADQGAFDPKCAVRALSESSQTLSDLCLHHGQFDEAAGIVESIFTLFCLRAAWKGTSPALRTACLEAIDEFCGQLVSILKKTHSSEAKIIAVYAIAGQAKEQAFDLASAA